MFDTDEEEPEEDNVPRTLLEQETANTEDVLNETIDQSILFGTMPKQYGANAHS